MIGFSNPNWTSITTAEFASRLVQFADAPIVDETGLTGTDSVNFETWMSEDVPGGTIFEAAAKLGLKLEPRKMNIDTVVIDQVSKWDPLESTCRHASLSIL